MISNLVGNLFLLTPLGIILKTKIKNRKQFILVSFIILFSIETTQLFLKVGSFDIDDVLLNSLGLFVGYLIYKKYKQKGQRNLS